MKTFRTYKAIVILLVLVILLTSSLFYFVPDFGKGDLYMGLVTFSVGLFAIGLYIKQKEDLRRDIASAILSEIRFAENGVAELQKALPNFDPWTTLLSTNSWNEYGYIFADTLDQDELDLINSFYADCLILQKAAMQLDPTPQIESKASHFQGALAEIAMASNLDESGIDDFEKKKKSIVELFAKKPDLFQPDFAKEKLITTLSRVKPQISTSTAGEKLKKIARQAKGY